jgi:beta-mannosidase
MSWPQRADLSSGWQATSLSSLGDETSEAIEVSFPHQWADDPRIAPETNAIRYSTQFTATHGTIRTSHRLPERHWLNVEGCFYACELAIDERVISHADGYFFPHAFSLEDAAEGDHIVTLDVRCDQQDRRTKRQLTGVFQHSDAIASDFNPGGIWKEISYVRTGPVAFSRLRTLCTEATTNNATVAFRAILDSDEARTITVRTAYKLRGQTSIIESKESFDLAAGENRVKWNIDISEPDLWWPAEFGDQPLYEFEVAIVVDAPDGFAVISDSKTFATGLRTVEANGFIFKINGKRIYLRGANYLPTDRMLSNVDTKTVKSDLQNARELGLNLLRLFGHVAHPSVYSTADELGILLWQDMPMIWGYSISIRSEATNQARELVNYFGHHPSIIAWFGHNQPVALDENDTRDRGKAKAQAKYFARQQLPTFSRTILGTLVHRSLSDADSTRPTFANSGALPHIGSRGSDAHLFIGWDRGELNEFNEALERIPSMGRFVGAFGAQSIPNTDQFLPVSSWPNWDWDGVEEVFRGSIDTIEKHTPVSDYKNFQEWKMATQQYQANLLRHHIERLRLLKYRPNGGFCFSYLNDAQPAISMSLFDYERQPKLAVNFVREVCREVLVILEWPEDLYETNTAVDLDVFVVNDTPHALGTAKVIAEVAIGKERLHWSWEGELTADGVSRVGTVAFTTPINASEITIALDLDSDVHPEIKQRRIYTSHIDG